jgi:hypothetical protein
MNLDLLTKYAGLGIAFLTLLGLITRFLTKYVRTERQEVAVANADISIYKKLQDEIARLERIVITQQTHEEAADRKFDMLRDLEMDGALDLGQLTMVLTHMPCHKCLEPADSLNQLIDSITRMNARRAEKQRVMSTQGASNVQVP